MGNANYLRGVYIERKLQSELNSMGYLSIRSAGSHSCVDIVGIPLSKDKPILLIQCKRSKLGISNIEKAFNDDIDCLRKVEDRHSIEKWVYLWVDHEGWTKHKIEHLTPTP